MDRGKISVIMGIYNCEDTLSEAIKSILDQTYENWELIMCDDASTDNTYQIAQKFADDYPDKIKLICNDENRKLAYSLNHCLEYSTGSYIARMDGDDISLPERFEVQMKYLDECPNIDLVGTAMRRFDENGLADIEYAADKPGYYTLRNQNPFNHATILARREVYDKLGGYTVAKRTMRAQDYDLWFRFFHEGFKGHNLKEPLYLVREDSKAVRRRTFRVRWNAHKTTIFGFNLLGYPKSWLIKSTVMMLVKSMIPYRIIDIYRNKQKQHS